MRELGQAAIVLSIGFVYQQDHVCLVMLEVEFVFAQLTEKDWLFGHEVLLLVVVLEFPDL